MTALAPAPAPTVGARRFASVDPRTVSAWVLPTALILYLGFDGGGYALTTSGRVGIVVWWGVIVACSWALLPAGALTRTALATLTAFGAFTGWTALGITWSISAGRSFQDLALITSYFGILVLAISIHRDRAQALRATVPAVAGALTLLAAVSLATRLWPGFIPSATHIAQTKERLSWPLDYWNALAALTAMALALLLGIATSARRLAWQAAGAAAIPIVALCGALTQSRGGVLETAAAVLVWILLSHQRLAKLATLTVCGLTSAVVIAIAFGDRAIRSAQTGALEHHQASQLVLALVLVCIGAGALQTGIGLLSRRIRTPQLPPVSKANRLALWLIGVVLCVLVAVAAGVPHHLSHAWSDFKNPIYAGDLTNHLSATAGEGRYQYWVAAIHSAAGHPLTGSGPGTFQLDWLPRARIDSYVINAHSLYVETYAELGLVGVGLLLAFIVLCLGAAIRTVLRTRGPERTQAAAITAVLVAFFLGAAFDWLWQMPVLVAVVLTLSAAVLAPDASSSELGTAERRGYRLSSGWIIRLGTAGLGVIALAAIVYPLAVDDASRASQAAIDAGNLSSALRDARHAVSLEPGSGATNLQLALVLERDHAFGPALAAAQVAVRHDAEDWVAWLTLSRIRAESGQARASLAAYRRARSLNPESPIFDLYS